MKPSSLSPESTLLSAMDFCGRVHSTAESIEQRSLKLLWSKIERLQSSHLRDCPAASLCYALSAPFGAFKVCRYDFIS